MTKRRISTIKLLLLIAITLLAACFRLYRLDTLPPGDGYDPAYYGVDALEILDGEWPLFLPANFGREALFSYLVALSVALFGVSPYAIHLTSAVVGILTIPAVYLASEELFAAEEGALGQFGGLVAALATAVSYWHLNWSRYGVRAVLLPLFAALVIFFLWRALRTNSRWLFALSGLFLGLSAYTYQAARVLPLVVVLGFVYYVALSRRTIARRDLANLAILGCVALLVFAPLGVYFVTHPGSFSQRIEQAAVVSAAGAPEGNLEALWNGIVHTLLVFNFDGDDIPLYNLAGRPALNPFLSLLFFAGLVASLLRLKRPAYPTLLTWLVVMSVPAMLSQYGPATKRAIGALPAVMMLIAVGGLAPWDALRRWAAQRQAAWARGLPILLAAALVLGFVCTAILTCRDYFVVWAGDPDLFTHFEVGISSIGEYAGSLPGEEKVYISPISPDHPGVVYNSRGRPGIKGYDGRVCLVVPGRASGNLTYVVVPQEDANSLDALAEVLAGGEIVAQGPLHYQQPYFVAYRVPDGSNAAVEPSRPLDVTWGKKIRLLGYDLSPGPYRPGDTIHLALYYQALEEMDRDYTAFVQLLGPHNPSTGNPLWGQHDGEPCRRAYPTSTWSPGEIIRDQVAITIAPEAPADAYQLATGLYLLETLERLPAAGAGGNSLPDGAAVLSTIEIQE